MKKNKGRVLPSYLSGLSEQRGPSVLLCHWAGQMPCARPSVVSWLCFSGGGCYCGHVHYTAGPQPRCTTLPHSVTCCLGLPHQESIPASVCSHLFSGRLLHTSSLLLHPLWPLGLLFLPGKHQKHAAALLYLATLYHRADDTLYSG